MHQNRHLLSETFLQRAQTRVLTMFLNERVNHLFRQIGENLDVAFSFFVTHIEPELVESIRSRAVAIEPNVALFRLTKLFAVCLGDEWTSQRKGFVVSTQFATN